MKGKVTRRPGLQEKWRYVVESLEFVIPIYERGSSRISLFKDRVMREDAVGSVVSEGDIVLDLGSGPGTMAKIVKRAKGNPVLLDASRRMLYYAPSSDKVQGIFEYLPFREEVFDGVVAGFSLRDSRDLLSSVREIHRVLKRVGKFSLCDLGKPDFIIGRILIATYIRLAAPAIGLLTGGKNGLRFGSLYDTYRLSLDNGQLVSLLRGYFLKVKITTSQLGGSIVISCKEKKLSQRL